jgi:hypothetical protein
MDYALIKTSVVSNVVVADIEPALPGYDAIVRVDLLEQKPAKGWSYDANVFTPPIKPPAQKSIHKTDAFVAMIPKAKIREIQAAAETDDDINMWLFNLPIVANIDLNRLPAWFTDGITAMVSGDIITQNQANGFLEVE